MKKTIVVGKREKVTITILDRYERLSRTIRVAQKVTEIKVSRTKKYEPMSDSELLERGF